jgi:protocatechuate 3,4-dioxygenase beta subunit
MKSYSILLLGIVLACGSVRADDSDVSISSSIVDEKDNPIAGAKLEYYSMVHRVGSTLPLIPSLKLESDTNGAFSLKVTNFPGYLIVTKPPFAPSWMVLYPGLEPDVRPIQLSEGTNLTGVVVDDSDKPVANVNVFVSSAFITQRNGRGSVLRRENSELLFKARTDSNGKFEITNLPVNVSVDLDVQCPGKVVRGGHHNFSGRENMMASAGDRDVKLILEPACVVEGTVVVPEGFGSGTNIFVLLQSTDNQGWEVFTTNAMSDGRFRFENVSAGTYGVRARFGTNVFQDWVVEAGKVTVASGESKNDIKLTPTRGGVLEVQVVGGADHKPITNASVNISEFRVMVGAEVDTNGVARMRMIPGHFRADIYLPDFPSVNREVSVEDGKTNREVVEVSAPKGNSIEGTVLGTNGKPAEGFEVQIFPNYGMARNAKTKTDANGKYKILINRQFMANNGTPCVVVRDVEKNLAAAKDIEEDEKTIDLQLQPGLTISGSVQNEKGEPLTNAIPHVVFWFGNSGMWLDQNSPPKVDAKGRFSVRALPRGRAYSVGVKADGYGSGDSNKEEMEESSTNYEAPVFTLKEAKLKIEGIVLDSDDKPVSGANVYTYGQGQPNVSALTKADGRFKFKSMCEGSVQISASKNSEYGNVRAEGGDTNVVLTLGSSSRVSSVVAAAPKPAVYLAGKPLPDLTVAGLTAPPPDKRVLVVLFDFEQRPCRRALKVINDQLESLGQKSVVVVGINALPANDGFKEWVDSKPVSFPLGTVKDKTDANRWITNVKSFPWLILTDSTGKVTAEGFGVDELESKLK